MIALCKTAQRLREPKWLAIDERIQWHICSIKYYLIINSKIYYNMKKTLKHYPI